MIMYYGGDALSLVLVVWLCADWYRHRQRAELRAARSTFAVARRETRVETP